MDVVILAVAVRLRLLLPDANVNLEVNAFAYLANALVLANAVQEKIVFAPMEVASVPSSLRAVVAPVAQVESAHVKLENALVAIAPKVVSALALLENVNVAKHPPVYHLTAHLV